MKRKVHPILPQKERKHRAILEAAKKVFLKQGFAVASMDDIANLAEVSKKTVYQHFASKENLFQVMLKEHWNKVFTVDKPFVDPAKPVDEYLTQFAHVFLNFLYQQETIDLFRVLVGESSRFPNLTEQLLNGGKAPFTQELIEFLTIKKKKKELQVKDPERMASYFMGLLKEYHFWPMMLGLTQEKKLTNQRQFVEEAVTFFMHLRTR